VNSNIAKSLKEKKRRTKIANVISDSRSMKVEETFLAMAKIEAH
jgi:hypothetical protein